MAALLRATISLLVNYYRWKFYFLLGKPTHSGTSSNHKKELLKNKKLKPNGHSTLKRPLYDNAKLEAPDGELLCVCDSRKARWYVTKGLGKLFIYIGMNV